MTRDSERPQAGNPGASKAFRGAEDTITPADLDAALVLGPQHGPSAWLRGVLAPRLADVDRLDPGSRPVVGPLVRRTTPGTREDRSCDRCGTYVPPWKPFRIVMVSPRPRVFFVGGLCVPCRDREVAGL